MALIHPKSCESIDTGLDLFSLPPTNTSVEAGLFVEYFPLATLARGAPIEFTVSGSGHEYLDLANTYLHLKAKVTENDGSNLPDGADVAACNLWHSTLISQCDVYLNTVLVSESHNCYPYRSYIPTLLALGRDVKKSQLTSELFYRDSTNHFEDTRGNDNTGLKVRRELCSRSKVVDMMGRLHVAIMNQNRYMLNGVDLKIRLIPSKSTFNLMAHDPAAGYLSTITHASLFVRKVKLNPAVSLAHEKQLLRGVTAKYPIKRVLVKTYGIPGGSLSATLDNLFLSHLPSRVFVCLVDSTSFNGHYQKNPFNFKHHGLTFQALYLDGKAVPSSQPLTPDFANGQWIRSFLSQSVGTGIHGGPFGQYLERRDFSLGNAVWVHDLSPSLLDGDQVELVKSGSLRLELKFRQALTEAVHVIILGEMDGLIEIDHSRQVITDMTS